VFDSVRCFVQYRIAWRSRRHCSEQSSLIRGFRAHLLYSSSTRKISLKRKSATRILWTISRSLTVCCCCSMGMEYLECSWHTSFHFLLFLHGSIILGKNVNSVLPVAWALLRQHFYSEETEWLTAGSVYITVNNWTQFLCCWTQSMECSTSRTPTRHQLWTF